MKSGSVARHPDSAELSLGWRLPIDGVGVDLSIHPASFWYAPRVDASNATAPIFGCDFTAQVFRLPSCIGASTSRMHRHGLGIVIGRALVPVTQDDTRVYSIWGGRTVGGDLIYG